jgi:hypothetical protein
MLHPFLSKPLDVHSLLVDTLSTNLSKRENNCDPLPAPFFFLIVLGTLLHTFSLPITTSGIACAVDKSDTSNHITDIGNKNW